MKASEIRDLEPAELTKHVAELRKEVFGLRFSNATGELDDTAGLGRAKRDLARALTVARQRELRSAGGAEN
ncbi:MAG: 50S ribosomal protein L29 [Solirubrobacteraceae bacterium]